MIEGNTQSTTHHKLVTHVSTSQDETKLGSRSFLQLSDCNDNSQIGSDQDPLSGKSEG
jgi:hypothetical protein